MEVLGPRHPRIRDAGCRPRRREYLAATVAAPAPHPQNGPVPPTEGRPPPTTPASTSSAPSALERIKELEFEQRGRLRSATRGILTLAFLRLAARRFLGRTLPAGARPVPRPPAGTVA